ncbi:MAG: glycosyltransferase family 39 protein [Planctomycetia bacterium]|nr:glycosyltransferase family 39 protein [Planctomycetia bacterium]
MKAAKQPRIEPAPAPYFDRRRSEAGAPWTMRLLESRWMIVAILAVAAGLCVLRIGAWSLWQDEETSIYFSQHCDKLFPRCSPIYFSALHGLFQITGVSVVAGRLLASFFGLLSIWLTYLFLRRYVSRPAGLVAAILLAACLDQLFWSQSIRYYTMVACFQLAALLMLYEGFEESRPGKLVLAGILFNIALFTNFTAVLLLPVVVVYLLLVAIFRQRSAGYSWRNMLALGVPALLGILAVIPRLLELRGSGVLGGPPPVQYPGPIIVRIVCYYGVPIIGLAIAAPLLVRRISRPYLLMFCWALLPVLELFTLGWLRLANVTWNHGQMAMYGCAALAGAGLTECWKAGLRRTAIALAAISLIYYGAFAVQYYTAMQGNRPPWRAGAEFVRGAAAVHSKSANNPPIYCTVPEVLAFYLDVPPGETHQQELVKQMPEHPLLAAPRRAEWYVVTRRNVTPEYDAWFAQNCQLKATFPAWTGPVDHSVVVYVRPAEAERR